MPDGRTLVTSFQSPIGNPNSPAVRVIESDLRLRAAPAFVETEAFFKSHGKADGVEMAQAGKKAADALVAGASGDAAKAAAGEIGKTCAGCHAKYRDKAADGSYTFKAGA